MLTPVSKIAGEDEEDTRLLREMAEQARNYITSFRWCLPIEVSYLAAGVGGIVAIFLFEFEGRIGGADDRLWVVVGDLPPAYMILVPGDNPHDAMEGYCELMDAWVAAVDSGGDFENVYPVAAERTAEHAEMLRSRLAFLRENIIPLFPTDPVDDEPDDAS